MLTIHHLANSQSERIIWLCEELELDYAIRRYERRTDNRMAPPEFKALHPLGISPTITDGELALCESGAITEYIVATQGQGRLGVAPGYPHYVQHLFWFHCANATLAGNILARMVLAMGGGTMNASTAFLEERKQRILAMAERQLAETPFFGGDALTLADIMMVLPLSHLRALAKDSWSGQPHTLAYLERIAARPAWLRARARAEPG
jgi:glutathione S-transferase